MVPWCNNKPPMAVSEYEFVRIKINISYPEKQCHQYFKDGVPPKEEETPMSSHLIDALSKKRVIPPPSRTGHGRKKQILGGRRKR